MRVSTQYNHDSWAAVGHKLKKPETTAIVSPATDLYPSKYND